MMDCIFTKSASSFHPSGEVVIVVVIAEETGVYSLQNITIVAKTHLNRNKQEEIRGGIT